MESPMPCKRSGSTATSNCFRKPPKLLISATPGVPMSRRAMIQSCTSRSSMGVNRSSKPGLGCTTYWYTSPRPVLSGAR